MENQKLTIKGRGFWGGLKKVDEEKMEQLSNHIMTGDELNITVLGQLTTEICIIDYGPALSLMELETFVKTVCKQIKELKPDYEELFAQFLMAINFMKEDGYLISNTCVMILKQPHCVIVRFGGTDSCKVLIHLGNHSLYQLGTNKSRPIPYRPGSFKTYEAMYNKLHNAMVEAEQANILSAFSGFEESLSKEKFQSASEMKKSKENTKRTDEAFGILLEELGLLQDKLTENEQNTRAKLESLVQKTVGGTLSGKTAADEAVDEVLNRRKN
eukprot:TRINITY_DN1499_c0_g1_i3.p1 TRINITY_DN1499_c0_g1~~TRINITY_DN1499_c0_g1_i3.p1  ORF type:complete len:271 (-),score=47.05 TRINITY_DN1499_c0_g1_i3:74-886(-)